MWLHKWIGLARTIKLRCICGMFGREITKYAVIYGACIGFWPTLQMESHPREGPLPSTCGAAHGGGTGGRKGNRC
jgi:hypothetical protein